MDYTFIETTQQAQSWMGHRKAANKLGKNSLGMLKLYANQDKATLHAARMAETDPAKRMHLNGAIAARASIASRIDQLLKLKNL